MSLVNEKLQEIIKTYGEEITNEPKRCKSLLLDYCGYGHDYDVDRLINSLSNEKFYPLDIKNRVIFANSKDDIKRQLRNTHIYSIEPVRVIGKTHLRAFLVRFE